MLKNNGWLKTETNIDEIKKLVLGEAESIKDGLIRVEIYKYDSIITINHIVDNDYYNSLWEFKFDTVKEQESVRDILCDIHKNAECRYGENRAIW